MALWLAETDPPKNCYINCISSNSVQINFYEPKLNFFVCPYTVGRGKHFFVKMLTQLRPFWKLLRAGRKESLIITVLFFCLKQNELTHMYIKDHRLFNIGMQKQNCKITQLYLAKHDLREPWKESIFVSVKRKIFTKNQDSHQKRGC